MARPTKEPHEKRLETARFRVSLAEHEYIREQARNAGMTPTDYMRARTLGHRVAPAPGTSAADPALVSELNRIGVNLNQITKAINAGRGLPHSLEAAAAELRETLRRVLAHGA